MRVPEPTTVLIVPAAMPAAKTTRICQLTHPHVELGPRESAVRVARAGRASSSRGRWRGPGPGRAPRRTGGGCAAPPPPRLPPMPALPAPGRRPARRPRAHPLAPLRAPGPASARSAPGCGGRAWRASGSATSISACTGRSAGRRSSSWLMAGMAVSSPASKKPGAVLVDGVAAGRTGYRRPAPGLGALGPLGRPPRPMDDDVDVQLESLTDRRRRGVRVRMVGRRPSGSRNSLPAQAGTTRARAVSGGQQHPHAGCRLLHYEPFELRAPRGSPGPAGGSAARCGARSPDGRVEAAVDHPGPVGGGQARSSRPACHRSSNDRGRATW